MCLKHPHITVDFLFQGTHHNSDTHECFTAGEIINLTTGADHGDEALLRQYFQILLRDGVGLRPRTLPSTALIGFLHIARAQHQLSRLSELRNLRMWFHSCAVLSKDKRKHIDDTIGTLCADGTEATLWQRACKFAKVFEWIDRGTVLPEEEQNLEFC
ncbi:hypothetical protein M011DRAFT_471005 [Sporormia fimetaria CBS 119925]|uniref:Uncharacterized protein n=1 Tax=Sporormia fimetaria CBS 119925 TaxID=1340428 RepID=A0A6A6V3W8_9PLEO|nr:hypothetical protein M011DRAFT_471005 [Sporormia fimetaria CBS 119925]